MSPKDEHGAVYAHQPVGDADEVKGPGAIFEQAHEVFQLLAPFENESHHSSSQELEAEMELTFSRLLYMLIHQRSYDYVCIAAKNWSRTKEVWDYGEFFSRGRFHSILYGYVIKRMIAVSSLNDEGYALTKAEAVWSDTAYAFFIREVVLNFETRPFVAIELPGLGRVVMVEDEMLQEAFRMIHTADMRICAYKKRKHVLAEFCFPGSTDDQGNQIPGGFDVCWNIVDDTKTVAKIYRNERARYKEIAGGLGKTQ